MWIRYEVGVRTGRIADVDEWLARHFIANGTAIAVEPPVPDEEPEADQRPDPGQVMGEESDVSAGSPLPNEAPGSRRRRGGRRPRRS